MTEAVSMLMESRGLSDSRNKSVIKPEIRGTIELPALLIIPACLCLPYPYPMPTDRLLTQRET
jgi:hypothetical protein